MSTRYAVDVKLALTLTDVQIDAVYEASLPEFSQPGVVTDPVKGTTTLWFIVDARDPFDAVMQASLTVYRAFLSEHVAQVGASQEG